MKQLLLAPPPIERGQRLSIVLPPDFKCLPAASSIGGPETAGTATSTILQLSPDFAW
jgi:hypothetical protein